MADDAGALLVRTGLITEQALVAARAARSGAGGTIGEQLVLAGAVTDEVLTEFYRSRLLVPRVNPNTLARLPAPVVDAIPADMAVEFRCVPVALDREGNLTVAMSDPSDRHAVDEVGFFTGKYVVRAVATQMQIAWCLAHYYGHITDLGRRLLKPEAARPEPAAPTAGDPAPEAPVARVRGFTDRVEAARHKVMPPVADAAPAAQARPSAELLTPTDEDLARVAAASANAAATVAAEVSGEQSDPYAVVDVAAAPETSGPYAQVHVSLLQNDEKTPPRGVRRKKPALPDPPELAARSGEMVVQERPVDDKDAGVPAVVVELGEEPAPAPEPPAEAAEAAEVSEPDDAEWDAAAWAAAKRAATADGIPRERDEAEEPAIVHDVARSEDSAPILLVPKRTTRDTLPDTDDDSDDDREPVVLLEPKKPPALSSPGGRRRSRSTQVGLGVPPARPRPTASGPTRPSEPLPAAAADVAGASIAAAASAAAETASAVTAGPPATPADGVPRVVEAARSDARTRPHYSGPETTEPDDGWGPPGTTIPPPFLGAMPGTENDRSSGQIPIPTTDDDSGAQPLIIGEPVPPPVTGAGSGPVAHAPVDPRVAARELEQASTRLVVLLRRLDHATTRDEAIDALLAYLHDTHERVAFFALKNQIISPFLQRPPSTERPPVLSLDTPSTLQDVVGTRLPYRGTIADAATRRFVTAAFGTPPGEVLALPIAVRDRVVAVLYGDGRKGLSFDEHFAVAARAAGLALERILQAKRAATQP